MAIHEYRRHALECLCIADENLTSPENEDVAGRHGAGLARISPKS